MTLAGASAALAQTVKPPVMTLAQSRIGQDYAQQQARVIQFANEDGVTSTFVTAPALASTSSGSSDLPTQWLKVEFHYSVNPEHPDKYPWVDSAQFKVWIEGRDLYSAKAPGAEGVAICLTGAVTYINLQKSRDSYGVFYVHPSVLARYCGSGSYEDFDRKFNVHVEAYVGGKLVDYFDKTKDVDKWWTAPVQISNLVCRQDQSPFLVSDVMRYPQIKLPASSDSGQ
jgi:hypothetical protein